MNYILKKIEKKIFYNKKNNFIFSTNIFKFQIKNIKYLIKYFLEVGLIKKTLKNE